MRRTLDDLKCPHLKVNFDPANMLLYDKDDPLKAVELLADFFFVPGSFICWNTGARRAGDRKSGFGAELHCPHQQRVTITPARIWASKSLTRPRV